MLWASLADANWSLEAKEPSDNPDLGPTTLGFLALLRLTEVEVHGTDLDIGATNWGDVFVETALPVRIRWLSTRRSNDPATNAFGTWVLKPHDATPFTVSATADGVSVVEGDTGDAETQLGGSKRDLLAFLLGRAPLTSLSISGSRDLAAAFKRAFPSP